MGSGAPCWPICCGAGIGRIGPIPPLINCGFMGTGMDIWTGFIGIAMLLTAGGAVAMPSFTPGMITGAGG
jgi:hypothetical protein